MRGVTWDPEKGFSRGDGAKDDYNPDDICKLAENAPPQHATQLYLKALEAPPPFPPFFFSPFF